MKTTVAGLEKAQVFRIKGGTFVNPKKKIIGTEFVNVSTYPTKVEIDIDILGDYAYDYLPQISYNIGVPLEELKDLVLNSDSEQYKKRVNILETLKEKKANISEKIFFLGGFESIDDSHPLKIYYNLLEERISRISNNENINISKNKILYRISIPFWRLRENCYCGDLYVSKEDFFRGVLIFNKSFGKFCINILPEHRFLIDDYYNRFIKMLKHIQMDERAFYFACPEQGNRTENIGHFCNICINSRKKAMGRLISKAIKSTKEKSVLRVNCNFKRSFMKVKTIHKEMIKIKEAV